MMAGNPTNWWSMMANAGTVHPPHHHSSSSSSSSPSYQLSQPSSSSHHFYAPSDSMPENPAQDFPRSWSQLLLGGAENEKFGMSPFQYKRMVQETWEDQIINGNNNHNNNNNNNNPSSSSSSTAPVVVDVIKHEDHFPQIGHLYGHNHHPPPPLPLVLENDHHHQYFQQTAAAAPPRPLPHHHHQEFASSSSPRSCVTTAFRDSAGNNNNNNVLIFSGHRSCPKPPEAIVNTHHSSQCNSTSTSSGGAPKKARVHQSSTQSSLKVRKEKLGDRITALHQLVSPFGKTDTASVLSEAIGYIRFLHTQIQALSSPYLGNASAGSMAHTHQQSEAAAENGGGGDLRSRGLCLVPLSCTDQHVGVGSDINGGADYWAPALGGGF